MTSQHVLISWLRASACCLIASMFVPGTLHQHTATAQISNAQLLTVAGRETSAPTAVDSQSGECEEIPVELRSFQQHQREPVFTGSVDGWDRRIRERGWIVRDEDWWHLWYTGYNPDETPPIMRLGYATSPDGIKWARHGNQPLIKDLWVEDMMVVRHENLWMMFAEGRNDQAQLLTSSDGIHWTRAGTLDIRLVDGSPIPAGPYGTPTAFYKDGVWNLYYERRDTGIWLARSSDLKVWTNISDDPIIQPGPDSYDAIMIAMNQVFEYKKRYYAVMHGTGTPTKPRQWCTYIAYSDDLIHWKKYSGNPVLPIPENKSSGQLVPFGTGFRLYTMHDKIDLHVPADSTQ
ncbi:MAG: glycosylase [Planctomyces sp.]|nr:glycosylase [Planctomyces sp.]